MHYSAKAVLPNTVDSVVDHLIACNDIFHETILQGLFYYQ